MALCAAAFPSALVAAEPTHKADAAVPAGPPAAAAELGPACLDAPYDPKLVEKQAACAADKSPGLCLFRLGHDIYSANRFAEAAPLFWEVITTGPYDLSEFAANLFVDCLSQLEVQAKPPRPSCRQELDLALPTIEQRLCGPGSPATSYVCPILARLKKRNRRCATVLF